MSERTIIAALVVLVTVIVSITVVMMAGRGGLAGERLKRIHELEAREAQLTEQLAQKDSQRESQRAVYLERIRKGEAQVREHAYELRMLRAQPVRPSTVLTARE